jgi:hypothetical protein
VCGPVGAERELGRVLRSSVTVPTATVAASPPRQRGGAPGTTGASPPQVRQGLASWLWVVPCVSSAASMASPAGTGGGLVRGRSSPPPLPQGRFEGRPRAWLPPRPSRLRCASAASPVLGSPCMVPPCRAGASPFAPRRWPDIGTPDGPSDKGLPYTGALPAGRGRQSLKSLHLRGRWAPTDLARRWQACLAVSEIGSEANPHG